MNAYNDLIQFLKGEKVESIVVGVWGKNKSPKEGEKWTDYRGSTDVEGEEIPLVPFDLRGKLISLEDLKPYMGGWRFYGRRYETRGYAAHVWTESRVIFVEYHDGYTRLSSVPRNPCTDIPIYQDGSCEHPHVEEYLKGQI